MFMLWSVLVGLAAGFALRGSLARLAELSIRWSWLGLGALAVQVVLFAGPIASVIGDAGAPIYVVSSAAVLLVIVRNVRLAGFGLIAVGAASNLAAITANGGWMPASPGALAALGQTIGASYSNSRVFENAMLVPLTDIFAMPAWLPAANIFSIGDVIISLGIAIAIAAGMRGRPRWFERRDRA